MTDNVSVLQAVVAEYNDWILAHARGESYDDFLRQRFNNSTKE